MSELTASQAAALVGVSRQTVYKWRWSGRLVPVREERAVGGGQPTFFFAEADVLRLAADRQTMTTQRRSVTAEQAREWGKAGGRPKKERPR